MSVYCRPSTRGQKVLSRPSAVTVGSQVPKSGSRGRGSGPKGAAMGPSGTRSSSTGSGQAKNGSLQCHRSGASLKGGGGLERWRGQEGPVAETSLLGERLSNQDRPPARLSREPPCHCRVPKRKGGRGGALPAPRPRSWAQRSPQGKQTPCLTASPNVHLSLHKPQLQRGPRPPRPTRTSGTVQDRLPGGLSQAESG